MSPRPRLRVGLAGAALAGLALTGCTPAEPAPTASSAPAPAASPTMSAMRRAAAAPTASSSVEGDRATVDRVIDGDTVDVRLAGDVVRVRLLNVDTPETKHPNKAVQCMGPEATELLESLLAPGDEVVLQYDEERLDRYGRTLAGVFEDGALVNAQIARAGLGVPVVFEPNRRFYPEVEAAWREAERGEKGLNQPGLECSLPVLASSDALGEPPTADVAAVSDLDAALSHAGATATAVALLKGAVDAAKGAPGPDSPPDTRTGGDPDDGHAWMGALYGDDLGPARDALNRYAGVSAWKAALEGERTRRAQAAAAAAEAERVEAERAEAERAEARRLEAERAAEQEAAAARAAEEAERAEQAEADAQAAAQREREQAAAREQEYTSQARGWADTSGGSSSDGSSSDSGSSGTSNKAPNRCYAPGGETYTYCEDQGSSDSGSGSSSGGSSSGSGSAGIATSGGSGGPVSGSGGVCPAGYPIKANDNSGIYHAPGQSAYEKTNARNCYASASAAAAAGYRAAKR